MKLPNQHLLHDCDIEVQVQAAISLIHLNAEELFEQLVAGLKSNREVAIGAALMLGRLKRKAAVPYLIAAFCTNDVELGSAVAWALGECEGYEAVPWLKTAVKSSFATAGACDALGKLGAEDAIDVLIPSLSIANEYTRVAAARALGRLRYRSHTKLDQVEAALKSVATDTSRRVRLSAAVSLYECTQKKESLNAEGASC